MKKKFWQTFTMFFLCSTLMLGCNSSSTSVIDTDDDDETLETANLATTMQNGAASLVLNMNASEITLSQSSEILTNINGSTDQWSQYLQENSYYILTDIFGSETEAPQVVTKIRVLLSNFFDEVDQMLTADPEVDCVTSPDMAETLADSDTITLPFYGEISNGSSDDRLVECLIRFDNNVIMYGLTADNTFTFISINDETEENTEDTENRGDAQRLAQITWVTYNQQTDEDTTTGYLDLQYAQSSFYNGPDGEFRSENELSEDDIVFKSRSRISGLFTLDEEGNVGNSSGEFFITKYDLNYTPDDQPITTVTQSHGRGGYAAGDVSIFSITTNSDVVSDANATFCLQMPETGTIPENVEPSSCADLEEDFSWQGATFPFDLEPAIEQVFADGVFFAGDNTDLIADDLSNFIIPEYTTE